MASLGPAPSSHWPLQDQNVLKSTLPGPAPASLQPSEAQLLPASGLFSFCRPKTSSIWHLQAQLLPPGNLCRPSLSLTTASLPPAPFSQWSFQA
ncbi:PREDICTED: putative uncharacterized protein FLJ46235 [Colobus angolensis palliatus]|uniref:putative uncharacterized protein FLJ46235 n=1 Tax=Colobus angolensis palliatus TaxID=336983 RepID=UPI0005F439B7|nr:PREDICTED: putative uncharacterized protein FLJ46235 [Colobus angolensis palliatus]